MRYPWPDTRDFWACAGPDTEYRELKTFFCDLVCAGSACWALRDLNGSLVAAAILRELSIAGQAGLEVGQPIEPSEFARRNRRRYHKEN